MVIKTLDSSTHFTYQWDTTVVGSRDRATALQATCESDLAKLESLFSEFNGFDANHVTVLVGDPGAGLATNNRFRGDGSTNITITGWSAVSPAATADAGVRLEFIAEMCEVMMGLRNERHGNTTWNPGGSNGEGLSQVLAESFYRQAYYDPQLKHGAGRITGWLDNGVREDWVTKTENSDGNSVSYGCAFEFIHFLHTQKGFSVQDIITKGADTLEATYTALTGHGGGWNEFIGLLNRFYPPTNGAGSLISYAPMRCNLFPLYDNHQRSTTFVTDEVTGVPSTSPGDSIVRISPGALCPVGEYKWHWIDKNSHWVLTVRPKGFGNPVVTWLVDGTAVPPGSSGVTITGEVDVDQAAKPGNPAKTSQTFHLSTVTGAAIDIKGPVATLELHPREHPGTERLTIEVQISEQYATDVPVFNDITWADLDTHSVEYEPLYYRDRSDCLLKWEDFLRRHVRYKYINILLTLPDPAPVELQRGARFVQELQHELAQVARADPKIAAQLSHELARKLMISPTTLQAGHIEHER
jgi:hypothetical protein